MGATLTTATSILKNLYLGPIRDQVNVSSPIWFRLKKTTKDVVGKAVIIPMRTGLNEGIGAIAENGVLPTAGNAVFKELSAALKYIYGVMLVSGPVIKATANDSGAFVRIMDAESQAVKDALSLDLNRMIHGKARGDLALCGVTTASTTCVLASSANMKNIRVGMIVDVLVTADGTTSTGGVDLTVSAVDEAAKTIVVSAAVTTDATFSVFRANSYNLGITGLTDILATVAEDVDIYGLDCSANPLYQANIKTDPTASKFNLSEFQDLLDATEQASGKLPTALFSRSDVRKDYWKILTGNRQYISVQPEKVMDGGFRALEYSSGGAGIPWIVDRFTPIGYVRGLHEPHLSFRNMPGALMELIDIKGEVWIPEISGASGVDAYKAVIYSYIELIADHRNSHCEMRDCTVRV